jgi:hypothetical protein
MVIGFGIFDELKSSINKTSRKTDVDRRGGERERANNLYEINYYFSKEKYKCD